MTIHRKLVAAKLALMVGLAATACLAGDSAPDPIRAFTADKIQVLSACWRNGGEYYEGQSGEEGIYSCALESGAFVLCWGADNRCTGQDMPARAQRAGQLPR